MKADKAIRPENLERLAPRLRVICNGDGEVNALRSELSATVQAAARLVTRDFKAQDMLQQAVPSAYEMEDLGEPEDLEDYTNRVKVSCFVQLDDPGAGPGDIPGTTAQRGAMVTADLTPKQLQRIADRGPRSGVSYIETGEPLTLPNPTITPRHVGQPTARAPESEGEPGTERGVDPGAESAKPAARKKAKNPKVLIGIVDVGGFDFAHPDFLTANGKKTRFISIWDQGAERSSPSGDPPGDFGYGAEITQKAMNDALAWSRKHPIGATDLVPQSVQLTGAHGTHVASIAAGNSGVCPDAAIAGVLVAITQEELARHGTLADSVRLAHAVEYLFDLAQREKIPTVVVNISLGTNGHAHDGSSPICRWIDGALNTPGRAVCVAAGNAGQEAPQFAGDLGFLMGRIHASGEVPAKGLEADLEWQVVGNGKADVSENELEIWYEAGDEFEVCVKPPSGDWIGPVGPGTYIENRRLASETFLSVYNERYHPANGANRISVFLSPRLKGQVVGIEAGTWLVRLRGVEVRDGRFDAWIERDDPRPLGRIGETDAWRFPSYFSKRTNVDRSSVSSLACGLRLISVGNCDAPGERIHPSSSQGPTRDGRYKPEIAAPGTDIVAARGFSAPDRDWIAMTGTSMASPFVAGVAACMLEREPRLTATQIVGIMRRTAQPLPGSDYRWQDDAGYGRIRPDDCLARVHEPFTPKDLDSEEENDDAEGGAA